ncbi:MAG: flagellar motor protein MotB [Armatimonadota bacterium]
MAFGDQPIIVKKIVKHGAARHGGSWKVAYADFVTAMMAFFMVMWIMGLSEQTKAQIQGYFNDPIAFQKAMPRSKTVLMVPSPPPRTKSQVGDHVGAGEKGEDAEAARSQQRKDGRDLAERIEGALGANPDLKKLLRNIDISVTDEGIRIELVESTGAVFFESGSDVIRPLAVRMIRKIAPILGATGQPVIVEGHTDAKPYAGELYNNWDLSTLRALALRRELAAAGLGSQRFLAVRGMAATQLRDPAHPYDFRNRRVSLLLPWSKATSGESGEGAAAIPHGTQAHFRAATPSLPPVPRIVGPK